MKKVIYLIPIILLIIGCGKDSLQFDKEEINSNQQIDLRDIDVEIKQDSCDWSMPCVEVDTLENSQEGCCVYRICLPNKGGKIGGSPYGLQIDGVLQPPNFTNCYIIEVCDRVTITMNWYDGLQSVICEFELVCGSEQCCPIEAEYSHSFDENHPEYADCCVFNYELTQDPPPGCEWVVQTGPNGVSAPWGIARICPGETLDLKLDCGDGELKDVCSLDLECPVTNCCDEPICVDYGELSFEEGCFILEVGIRGSCGVNMKWIEFHSDFGTISSTLNVSRNTREIKLCTGGDIPVSATVAVVIKQADCEDIVFTIDLTNPELFPFQCDD